MIIANRDQVLDFVKRKGPVIPNDIKKELGSDTFVLGAILSELADKKLVKVSSTKIGGSPTYYCPGHEYRLESLRKWLNEKDQRAFDLLKEKKILRDYEQTPLVRVSLRAIKDFAKALEVNTGGEPEIFWKWHTLSDEEAEKLIKRMVEPAKEAVKEEKREEAKEESPKASKTEARAQEKEDKKEEIEKKEKKIEKKEIEKEKLPIAAPSAEKKELKAVDDTGDQFMKKLKNYFEERKIRIIENIKVKKNREAELIVDLPTSVGRMEYYCRAKNKKKCNDGDLSSAYIIGQAKKMPVLFITTGDLTKAAQEMLNKEFKGMVVKKI
jgi:hypothetical protein